MDARPTPPHDGSPPRRVDDVDAVAWDDTADVVVVGLGGAGVVAALEAREAGADVLAVDRFGGGGATAVSGGVVYAGGGTAVQAEAGVDDTVDAMEAYLRAETDGVVSDATLRRFCETSGAHLAWLADRGVPFEASLCPVKTSYPSNRYYLYLSGNEALPEFAALAPPAARGHRTKGTGLPGAALYAPLRARAEADGVRVHTRTRADRLVLDAAGRVVGVEVIAVRPGWPARLHDLAWRVGLAVKNYLPQVQKRLTGLCTRLEARHGRRRALRARRGVILTTGGFVYDRAMMKALAPAYRPGMPLGTPGCDGSGIRMGVAVGAATDRLDRVSAWRFLNPPMAWAQGVVVDREGVRYCNESAYGARLGRQMVEAHDGEALLVLDDALLKAAWRQLAPGRAQWFQQAPGVINMLTNRRSAPTLEGLAAAARVPAEALRRTVEAYNAAIAEGRPDDLGKDDAFRRPLTTPPFHVMDVGIRSKRFPCPTLTLGGLVVSEETGAVLQPGGDPIPGLFAAGRTAVGVSSENYVSGLSIADCVFSGRRAGRHVAQG